MDGTANEVQWLRGAEGHRITGTLWIVDTATLLAREVAPIIQKRTIVESRLSEWNRGRHHNVGTRVRGHAKSGDDGRGEMHVDSLLIFRAGRDIETRFLSLLYCQK